MINEIDGGYTGYSSKINLFFGKVTDILDKDEHIKRVRISIKGYTDELPVDKMPWYFPFYGVNFLPEVDDIVPVLIFDNNFVTGFYGRKIDCKPRELDDDDYKFYLEVYKRKCGDDEVQLTYTKSKGIEFINKDCRTVIEIDKTTFFCKANYIEITEDKINLGDGAKEATPLGDKTVKELHDIIKHQKNTIEQMYKGFNLIIAGCTSPFTAPIAAQLAPHLPTKVTLIQENTTVDTAADKIQSKKCFIE